MSEPKTEQQASAAAPPQAQFRLRHLAWWLPLCVVHGTAIGWLAYGLQKHSAPLVLFPILVGVGLGVTLAGLMRLTQVGGSTTVVVGTIISVGAAVFGQHYFSYQEQRETAEQQAAQFRIAAQAHPGLVQGTPPKPISSVLQYLRWQALRGREIVGGIVARGAWAWASWGLDGCLTLVAALLVVVPAGRQPYCNQCRTWFSTVRRGRLAVANVEELAAAIGIESPNDVRLATYRFVHCQGGCGVAGFEICWELGDGHRHTKRVWLSPDDRSQLEKLLDPARTPDP